MSTYYISLRGKRTTITVNDALAAYLVVKIGGWALIGPRSAREHVGKWIRTRIKKEQSEVPEKNVIFGIRIFLIKCYQSTLGLF